MTSDPVSVSRVYGSEEDTRVGEDVTEDLTKLRAQLVLAQRAGGIEGMLDALESVEETLEGVVENEEVSSSSRYVDLKHQAAEISIDVE